MEQIALGLPLGFGSAVFLQWERTIKGGWFVVE